MTDSGPHLVTYGENKLIIELQEAKSLDNTLCETLHLLYNKKYNKIFEEYVNINIHETSKLEPYSKLKVIEVTEPSQPISKGSERTGAIFLSK